MALATHGHPPIDQRKLTAQIQRRVRELLQRAAPLCRRHGADIPEPTIHFDLRGLTAGQARWPRRGRPILRFNLSIAGRHPQAFIERTVAHEVAHLLTTACHGRTAPHGPAWRQTMAFLGIADPDRCHDYTVDEAEVRRQRRWRYDCDCSRHQLSTTRHKRVTTGMTRYVCRRCNTALRRVEDDP